MATHRKDFQSSEFNTVCRDMCPEARQRIWELDQMREFVIGDKTLKKKPPKKRCKPNSDNKVDDVGTSQQSNNSTNSTGNECNDTSIPMSNQLQQQQMNNNVV
jgi:hypothetical protein